MIFSDFSSNYRGINGKYKITKVLPPGGSGTTFVAELFSDSTQEFALKMISLEDIDNILELEQEIQLHKVLSENEYIITIIEHFFEENMLTIVTEYAKKGDLAQKIRRYNQKRKKLNDLQILKLMIEISKGVVFIHSQHIVHRDLKPANIFIDNQGRPKIGDFGISRVLTQQFIISGHCTPDYAPPEQWQELKFDYQGDVWSMGVMMYELCTGYRPFEGLIRENKKNYIIHHDPDFDVLKDRNHLLSMLVKSMLKKIPSSRPTMQNALEALERIEYEIKSGEEIYNHANRITKLSYPNERMYIRDIEEGEKQEELIWDNVAERGYIEELIMDEEGERIKMNIYINSNVMKWICFLLGLCGIFQMVFWVNSYPIMEQNKSSKERGIWVEYDWIPSMYSLLMMNSLFGYAYSHHGIYTWDIVFLWETLIMFVCFSFSNKLKRYNILVILTLLLFYLFFYIFKICYLSIYLRTVIIPNFSHYSSLHFIFMANSPTVIFTSLVLIIALRQLILYNKLGKNKNKEIVLQLTKVPLYESNDYVQGLGIVTILWGIKNSIYYTNLGIYSLIYSTTFPHYGFLGFLYIIGGAICLIQGRKKTLASAVYCYFSTGPSQIVALAYSWFSAAYGYKNWLLAQEVIFAFYSLTVSLIYMREMRQRTHLERRLFQIRPPNLI